MSSSSRTSFLRPLRRLLLLAPLALAGCGFTPLYGQSGTGSVAAKLDTVDIQNIPERPGQMLRLALQTQFYAAGAPTIQNYALAVSFGTAITGTGTQEDTSTTRERFVANATWTLTAIGTPQKTLATGTATMMDALNVIDQQYFALTLETDTVNQEIANGIASQITEQVGAYFKSHS